MSLDYDKILRDLKQHYVSLEQRAQPNSVEKHTYGQILVFMDRGNTADTPPQRAFETQISLNALLDTIDPPSARSLVREALNTLTQDTSPYDA